MFFTIKSNAKVKATELQPAILAEAKRRIAFYPMGIAETKLNEYLKNNYKFGLKAACIYLLKEINFTTDSADTIILNFMSSDLNKLALLITYGIGSIQGSKILQFAFDQTGG